MAAYHPREIKAILACWGYVEEGLAAPDDAALADIGAGYCSRPPSQTFAAHVDLVPLVERLPAFERRCVYGFSAILGGGPWRRDWEDWAPKHGYPLRLDGAKAPAVYRLLRAYLAEDSKWAVSYGVERACVRLALWSGWQPTADEEKGATYGRHLRSIRYWDTRAAAQAS